MTSITLAWTITIIILVLATLPAAFTPTLSLEYQTVEEMRNAISLLPGNETLVCASVNGGALICAVFAVTNSTSTQ